MSEPEPSPRCPFPHGEEPATSSCPATGAVWDAAAAEHAARTARASAPASHLDVQRAESMARAMLDVQRAESMARAAAESRADQRRVAEITELFVRTLGRKLGHGHPLSERTGMAEFTWTEAAEARLRDVPEFCRELTRWRVEWTAHKLGLGTTITPEVMQVKYDMWGRVSHSIQERHDDGLPWTDQALERFERIPEFVRGQVLEAIEGNARNLGADLVDDAVVDSVIGRWTATGDFHEGLYGFR